MHASGTSPARGLNSEHQAANTLLQLLKQEQAALVDADVERLTGLTKEKAMIASQMAQLAKQRHSLLAAAGFEATEIGMQAWLGSEHATSDDTSAWKELLAIVQSANEQNRVNGLLIGQHLVRNQAALNILQGNGENGAIYGPNGQSATKIGSRRLVVG